MEVLLYDLYEKSHLDLFALMGVSWFCSPPRNIETHSMYFASCYWPFELDNQVLLRLLIPIWYDRIYISFSYVCIKTH